MRRRIPNAKGPEHHAMAFSERGGLEQSGRVGAPGFMNWTHSVNGASSAPPADSLCTVCVRGPVQRHVSSEEALCGER